MAGKGGFIMLSENNMKQQIKKGHSTGQYETVVKLKPGIFWIDDLRIDPV
jgi:hypothetical protein